MAATQTGDPRYMSNVPGHQCNIHYFSPFILNKLRRLKVIIFTETKRKKERELTCVCVCVLEHACNNYKTKINNNNTNNSYKIRINNSSSDPLHHVYAKKINRSGESELNLVLHVFLYLALDI